LVLPLQLRPPRQHSNTPVSVCGSPLTDHTNRQKNDIDLLVMPVKHTERSHGQ
jgi:hypothetical protein